MKYIFIFLPLLFSNSLHAQINYDDNSVQVIPVWNVGDIFEYSFKNEDYVISINDTISKIYTNSKKKISVLDENQFVYKIQWENTDVQTNDPDVFYKEYMTNARKVKYQYATNKDGEFLELLNEISVRSELLDIANKMLKKNKKDAVYQSNVNGLFDMIKSDDYVNYAFSQEINNMFQFNGLYFQLGEKYVGKQIQDNFFGYPISSTTTTWLDQINKESETYTIATSQELSKEDFENLWKFMAQSMLDQSNINLTKEQVDREISKYSDTLELKVDNRNTYNKNSILINSQYKFSLNIGTRKTINLLEIQLL